MEKALVMIYWWFIRNYILQFQEFFYFIQILLFFSPTIERHKKQIAHTSKMPESFGGWHKSS